MEYRFVRATTSIEWEGYVFHLIGHQAWLADDPLVCAHPELFSAKPLSVSSSVGAFGRRKTKQVNR